MKLENLLKEQYQVETESTNEMNLDPKGKVQTLTPALKGDGQCPFWKLIKTKIAGRVDITEVVKIPKVFAEDAAKKFKVPLDPTYDTPVCVAGNKTCSYFTGLTSGKIGCSFGEKKAENKIDNAKGIPEQPIPQAQLPKEEPKKIEPNKIKLQGEV
jgi:hypothetical protein